MSDHPNPTLPPWELVNTVHSHRKLLFSLAPGHERFIATLVSGSREDLQIFKADARLMTASPQLLAGLEQAIRAMNHTPSFNTGISDPATGRNLNSYRLLPELEAIVRAARQAP